MDANRLQRLAANYLNSHHMMQLATEHSGQPWCCTVYYVTDTNFTFYWASLTSRRHSQEIKNNSRAAIAVPIKHVAGEPVVGLQAEGKAQVLSDPRAIRPAAETYAAKFGRDQSWVDEITSGQTEHRVYEFKPTSLYLFDEVNYPGGQRQPILTS